VSAQYPTPPKPPTTTRKPPPSSGAERYRKNFAAPQASAYQAAQEGPQARKSTYEAWENLRHPNPKTDHGPGKTWKSPQPPLRSTPTSGRDESNARTQRPVPSRPQGFDEFRESSSGHQRSHSSSAANRKGFMPNTPGGDEPPAPRGNYFTQRDKPSVAPDLPSREPPSSRDNAGPDPLRQFREKVMPTMEPRISTPYATHGGEKFNPFESANINRSKSTRARNETYDPKSSSSPRTGDPNLKAPHRSRSFVEQRSTSRPTRPTYTASVDLDSSSSDELPQTNGSAARSSAQRNNGATSNSQPRPQPAPNASGPATTSKPSRVSLFRQWMKENPNTEPPPNGFPPDGPPLRSAQAKTDANGNPSMYETSSFYNHPSFNPENKRSSIYEVTLPAVAETISSRPQYSTSKTELPRSASMKFPTPLFPKDRHTTPPSGVAIDPEKLNTFETLQRTVIDGLLSNKRASSSGQKPQAARTGLSGSQWSNQGTPLNSSNLRHSGQPGDFHTYRDSAEAGSPSKKFKPLKHLHSSHTYDFDKSQAFWVEHDKRKRSANHARQSSRFSFDFPDDTFTNTRPPKNSFSSSAENISTKFTPEDWKGKFEAGGDYFRPEQKAPGMPGRGRTQSGSRSRGRSPAKVRTTHGDIPYIAPPTEPTPLESPGGTKFSAAEWTQTFKPQTFAPPPAGPVPQRAVPPKKRTGPTLRTTMGGNAAVVDDGSSSEEKPLFTNRKPTASPITVSPDPMDVDTPPVTNTVPQFTAAKINEKLSEPLKRPAASGSSSPTDTASLKVGFEDLKIRDLINSLSMPPPPKAPTPPTPSELGSPSRAAYEDYVKRYAKYMSEWDIFNATFLLHLVARKNQTDNAAEKRWTDEKATELYRLGLKEDQAVLQRWMEAKAAHEGVVKDFCIVRERMKGLVERDSGGGANLGGKAMAPERERTTRASPRKKTH
jgi:hypothetical protein